MLLEANEYLLGQHEDDNALPSNSVGISADRDDAMPKNEGTLILDATYVPVNIRYSQDVSLVNEARKKLEAMLWRFHKAHNIS